MEFPRKKLTLMKTIRKLPAVFLFLAFLGVASFSQKSIQGHRLPDSPVIILGFDPHSAFDWKRFDIGNMSFYAPKYFKMEYRRGLDLSSWVYKDSAIEFRIYFGPDSPNASGIVQRFPSYHKKAAWVNDIYTDLWSYEDESSDYRYVFAARFYIENKPKGDAVTIYLQSTNNDQREFAEKIFSSVKFKPVFH